MKTRTYEAMFLLDAGSPDFEAASAPVRELLARIGAEVLVLKPWDERRLCYEIKGRKRGLYVLTYFKAQPSQVIPLQHEVQLDERILRALVLTAETVTPEQMNAPVPASGYGARRADEGREAYERPAGQPAAGAAQQPPAAEPAPPEAREEAAPPAQGSGT